MIALFYLFFRQKRWKTIFRTEIKSVTLLSFDLQRKTVEHPIIPHNFFFFSFLVSNYVLVKHWRFFIDLLQTKLYHVWGCQTNPKNDQTRRVGSVGGVAVLLQNLWAGGNIQTPKMQQSQVIFFSFLCRIIIWYLMNSIEAYKKLRQAFDQLFIKFIETYHWTLI